MVNGILPEVLQKPSLDPLSNMKHGSFLFVADEAFVTFVGVAPNKIVMMHPDSSIDCVVLMPRKPFRGATPTNHYTVVILSSFLVGYQPANGYFSFLVGGGVSCMRLLHNKTVERMMLWWHGLAMSVLMRYYNYDHEEQQEEQPPSRLLVVVLLQLLN